MALELGELTLSHLTHITVNERARILSQSIPGLEGDLLQVFGRHSVSVRFKGIFYGENALSELDRLRQYYLANGPVDFFTSAVGEGYFSQVLVSHLQVNQQAGYPEEFAYECEVTEYVEPPPLTTTNPMEALDTELFDEATSFMDDVQNTLAEVTSLVDLIANVPNFGDPTTQLPGMLDAYSSVASGGKDDVGGIVDSIE